MNIKMKRITGTILVFLTTICLTYFCFYTEQYIKHFDNIKEPEVKITYERSEIVKEVSFFGIEFKNTNIGSNTLLTEYNIYLKETKNIKNSTFVYLDSSNVNKENLEMLLTNKFKLISCFDRTYGSCLFYNQDGKTNIYDEIALEFVLSKANRIPGVSTLKYNLQKQNNISVINDLGIDIPKEFILGENTFYTENSIFKKESNSKKEERFLFGLFLHFINLGLFVGAVSFFVEGLVTKEDSAGVFFFFLIAGFFLMLLITLSPFDFLISI